MKKLREMMLFHLIPWASNCQLVLFSPPVLLPCLEGGPEFHAYPVPDLMVRGRWYLSDSWTAPESGFWHGLSGLRSVIERLDYLRDLGVD